MAVVRKPIFKIAYNGKDISADLTPFLMSAEYIDRDNAGSHLEQDPTKKDMTAASDEIQIEIEDTDERWRNEWYPTKGDQLKLQIGDEKGLLDCGVFTIDELELSGPPHRTVIRALASWVTSAMRTRGSASDEGQTLRQIAERVAAKHGLTVEGQILTLRIARSTQHRETDLEYLRRLADEYGYLFSIKGDKLVFESIFEIESGEPVYTLDVTDVMSYQLKDKTSLSFKDAQVAYHNPGDRKTVRATVATVKNADGVEFNEISAADTLVIKTKAENEQQAQQKAKVALYKSKGQQLEGSITVEGNAILVAGNNIVLTGFGQQSGKYHIIESHHRIEKGGGYVTTCQIKRVGYVEFTKHKSTKKKKRKPKKYDVKVVG